MTISHLDPAVGNATAMGIFPTDPKWDWINTESLWNFIVSPNRFHDLVLERRNFLGDGELIIINKIRHWDSPWGFAVHLNNTEGTNRGAAQQWPAVADHVWARHNGVSVRYTWTWLCAFSPDRVSEFFKVCAGLDRGFVKARIGYNETGIGVKFVSALPAVDFIVPMVPIPKHWYAVSCHWHQFNQLLIRVTDMTNGEYQIGGPFTFVMPIDINTSNITVGNPDTKSDQNCLAGALLMSTGTVAAIEFDDEMHHQWAGDPMGWTRPWYGPINLTEACPVGEVSVKPAVSAEAAVNEAVTADVRITPAVAGEAAALPSVSGGANVRPAVSAGVRNCKE